MNNGHDRLNKFKQPCRFFSAGYCRFQDRCRFRHVKPELKSPIVEPPIKEGRDIQSQAKNLGIAPHKASKNDVTSKTEKDVPNNDVNSTNGSQPCPEAEEIQPSENNATSKITPEEGEQDKTVEMSIAPALLNAATNVKQSQHGLRRGDLLSKHSEQEKNDFDQTKKGASNIKKSREIRRDSKGFENFNDYFSSDEDEVGGEEMPSKEEVANGAAKGQKSVEKMNPETQSSNIEENSKNQNGHETEVNVDEKNGELSEINVKDRESVQNAAINNDSVQILDESTCSPDNVDDSVIVLDDTVSPLKVPVAPQVEESIENIASFINNVEVTNETNLKDVASPTCQKTKKAWINMLEDKKTDDEAELSQPRHEAMDASCQESVEKVADKSSPVVNDQVVAVTSSNKKLSPKKSPPKKSDANVYDIDEEFRQSQQQKEDVLPSKQQQRRSTRSSARLTINSSQIKKEIGEKSAASKSTIPQTTNGVEKLSDKELINSNDEENTGLTKIGNNMYMYTGNNVASSENIEKDKSNSTAKNIKRELLNSSSSGLNESIVVGDETPCIGDDVQSVASYWSEDGMNEEENSTTDIDSKTPVKSESRGSPRGKGMSGIVRSKYESGRKKHAGYVYGSKRSALKLRRCGECEGCVREDCRKCKFCVDSNKYGGPNKLKRCCINRVCLWKNPIGLDKNTTLQKVAKEVGRLSDGRIACHALDAEKTRVIQMFSESIDSRNGPQEGEEGVCSTPYAADGSMRGRKSLVVFSPAPPAVQAAAAVVQRGSAEQNTGGSSEKKEDESISNTESTPRTSKRKRGAATASNTPTSAAGDEEAKKVKTTDVSDPSTVIVVDNTNINQVGTTTSAQTKNEEQTTSAQIHSNPTPPEEDKEVVVECFAPYVDLRWVKIGKEKDDARPVDVQYARSLRPPFHLVSFLRIRGLSTKGTGCTDKNTMIFIVLEGQVNVVLHTTEFVARKGDTFYVPPKNYYKLVNKTTEKVELSLIQYMYDGPLKSVSACSQSGTASTPSSAPTQ